MIVYSVEMIRCTLARVRLGRIFFEYLVPDMKDWRRDKPNTYVLGEYRSLGLE
jgi:hypothetical protein